MKRREVLHMYQQSKMVFRLQVHIVLTNMFSKVIWNTANTYSDMSFIPRRNSLNINVNKNNYIEIPRNEKSLCSRIYIYIASKILIKLTLILQRLGTKSEENYPKTRPFAINLFQLRALFKRLVAYYCRLIKCIPFYTVMNKIFLFVFFSFWYGGHFFYSASKHNEWRH
jgi:hypothetical protein